MERFLSCFSLINHGYQSIFEVDRYVIWIFFYSQHLEIERQREANKASSSEELLPNISVSY